jgi:hypothetical protein
LLLISPRNIDGFLSSDVEKAGHLGANQYVWHLLVKIIQVYYLFIRSIHLVRETLQVTSLVGPPARVLVLASHEIELRLISLGACRKDPEVFYLSLEIHLACYYIDKENVWLIRTHKPGGEY